MATNENSMPVLEFQTKDIANFVDLLTESARLFALKNTPTTEGFLNNRKREVLRARAHMYEAMVELLNPFNVTVTSYSELKVNFGEFTSEETSIEFIADAYVHPADGNPAETQEALHRVRLVLDRS